MSSSIHYFPATAPQSYTTGSDPLWDIYESNLKWRPSTMASAAEIEIQALRDLNNTAPSMYVTAPTLASPAQGCFTVNSPDTVFSTWTPVPDPYNIWQPEQGPEEFSWMQMRPDPKSFDWWNLLKWVAVIGSCAAALGSLI